MLDPQSIQSHPRFARSQTFTADRGARFGQVSRTAALSIVFAALGCGDDNTGDTSGGDTGSSPCGDCPAGKEMSDCICDLGFNQLACHNDSSCQSWCAAQGDNMNYRNPWCASTGESTSCVGWDPASDVSFNNGVYAMDYGFAQQVYANTSQMIVCDSAVFEALPAGGFELANVSTRDLAYALGLRNGGYPRFDQQHAVG